MKLTVRTVASADPLLRKAASDLNYSLEDIAEVAIYNFLAVYLVDKYGHEEAQSFLEHLNTPCAFPGRSCSG